MSDLLIEDLQFVKGLDPIADSMAGGVYSDVINMKGFSRIVFAVYRGVATGGTAAPTYTVEACDDTTPTNHTAIAFEYRKSGGALAAATSSGFQATAGSSAVDLIEVREDALAALGYGYVRLGMAETVNDPVVGAVLVIGEAKEERAGAYPDATV